MMKPVICNFCNRKLLLTDDGLKIMIICPNCKKPSKIQICDEKITIETTIKKDKTMKFATA